MSDTIFALSSGQGRAGVAVIRMSGPGVREAFRALCGEVPPARRASLTTIRDGDKLIDKGLCLFFPAPRSFTGEDMGEFQVHGGRAVIAALLDALSKMPGMRPAERGEFTKRAFVNGKLDLVEVEALADLVAAETGKQLELARRLASGELSRLAETWRRGLVAAMAELEASIDFVDEGDVGADVGQDIASRVAATLAEIDKVLADGQRGERLRDGVTIVIAGPPNAGKSTLLNALARRDVAIVSPEAGTTRDFIEVQLDLGGVPVTLVDTAGLRDQAIGVEAIGIDRARRRLHEADLVVWLAPLDAIGDCEAPDGTLVVGTKADLVDGGGRGRERDDHPSVSALTGAGMPELLSRLAAQAAALAGGEGVLIARARQRAALADCAAELRALTSAPAGEAVELQAERLRLALRALGRLTGRMWRKCWVKSSRVFVSGNDLARISDVSRETSDRLPQWRGRGAR